MFKAIVSPACLLYCCLTLDWLFPDHNDLHVFSSLNLYINLFYVARNVSSISSTPFVGKLLGRLG